MGQPPERPDMTKCRCGRAIRPANVWTVGGAEPTWLHADNGAVPCETWKTWDPNTNSAEPAQRGKRD